MEFETGDVLGAADGSGSDRPGRGLLSEGPGRDGTGDSRRYRFEECSPARHVYFFSLKPAGMATSASDALVSIDSVSVVDV